MGILQTKESDKWKIRESLCSHPGTDVTGMFARVDKVAGSCEKVLFLSENISKIFYGI